MDPAAEVSPRAWELISSLLFDTEGLVNPYDIYRQLHAIGDDFLTPNGTHIVIGYKALANMMRDPKFRKKMERVPRHGIGYGLLRYLSGNEELRKRMADCRGRK